MFHIFVQGHGEMDVIGSVDNKICEIMRDVERELFNSIFGHFEDVLFWVVSSLLVKYH
jgi:hypothetical protein